jgi:integrase
MPAITIRALQGLKPNETIWDGTVKGFGVRRQRRDPIYVVKYRVFGKQRFVTIGRHGVWTPEKARREAKRLLGLVATGNDPALTKIEAHVRAGDTLGNVATEYLKYAAKTQRPSSYGNTERYLLVNWKPFHAVPLSNLKRRDIAKRVAEIEANHSATVAARARTALSAMFNWALREGYDIPTNPVLGTNRPVEPKSRDRVLTDSELAAIWCECGEDDFGRIVKLLMLTGQRRDEVGKLRWSEVDLDRKLWTIPGERTKNHREHVVPLSSAAFVLIPEQRRDDYVFGQGVGFSGWSKARARLTGVSNWRLHDLRRSVATGMAELGVLPHIIEAVLNHVSGHRAGVAGIYNRARYEPEVRAALERWAAHVATIAGGA